MPDSADDFGERAATEDEAEAWVEMIRTGRRATTGYRFKPNTFDRMRPVYGSNKASSEGDD